MSVHARRGAATLLGAIDTFRLRLASRAHSSDRSELQVPGPPRIGSPVSSELPCNRWRMAQPGTPPLPAVHSPRRSIRMVAQPSESTGPLEARPGTSAEALRVASMSASPILGPTQHHCRILRACCARTHIDAPPLTDPMHPCPGAADRGTRCPGPGQGPPPVAHELHRSSRLVWSLSIPDECSGNGR